MQLLGRAWRQVSSHPIIASVAVGAAALGLALVLADEAGPAQPNDAPAPQVHDTVSSPARPRAPVIRSAVSTPRPGVGIADQAFDCVIEPYQVVKLSSPVIGVIGNLNVERGDHVSKGEVLGYLDNHVEQANLALARAKAEDNHSAGAIREHLVFLRVKQKRAEELAAKNFATQAVRDEAAADTRVAEEQLRQAELNERIARLEVTHNEQLLRQKTLVSPLDGVVTDILLRPGEYRDEQSPILSLAQIDPLRVEVFVPTRFYGNIAENQTATVMPEAPVGGSYQARITIVDKVIDAASGTFGVRLEMSNPRHIVPAGLKCRIRFG